MKKYLFWALLLAISVKQMGAWAWAHIPDTGWMGVAKNVAVHGYGTVSGWDKSDWTVVGAITGLMAAYSFYRKGRRWMADRGSSKSLPATIRSADDAIRNAVGHANNQLPKLIRRAMGLVAKAEKKGYTRVSMDLEKYSPITRRLLADGLVELGYIVDDAHEFAGDSPSKYPDEVLFFWKLKTEKVAAAATAGSSTGPAPETVKVPFSRPLTGPVSVPSAWWKSAWGNLT